MSINIAIDKNKLFKLQTFFNSKNIISLVILMSIFSVLSFYIFYANGLGLSYNDARSHLDIGRRVVEGLKPGFAQLGSVWLPLPHLLMVPSIWVDILWHSGLSGAIQSMISFIETGLLIYLFLRILGVGILGRMIGVLIFATNINILYLQSTAMTELLLIATMTAGAYELFLWNKSNEIQNLIKSSFWIMLSTLVRYDGWFLLAYASVLVAIQAYKKFGRKGAEGMFFFFITLGGFGIFLWFLWNLLIFKDPLYFAYGSYSAYAQQDQLQQAGVLATKGNLLLSVKVYYYALVYNSSMFNLILGVIGAVIFWFDNKIKSDIKILSTVLFAPFFFNVLALYLGHSVLFVQGISGNTWFNVRYGIMMMPSIAIFTGYLIHKAKSFRYILISLLIIVTFLSFANIDAVTIDDARVGSSQKNVSEVSGWLNIHTKETQGYILISVASHDAIIFSSGLPMGKFIHEGTGLYWENATTTPQEWARWIVLRTYDMNDLTYKTISKTGALDKYYNLVGKYPFSDIYEIKPQYVSGLITKPILGKQK